MPSSSHRLNFLSPHAPDQASPVAVFLELLMTTGELVVPPYVPSLAQCDTRCQTILVEREAEVRIELGLDLPPFNLVAAEWAAVQLFRASQFLVCRDVSAETVAAVLAEVCPCMRNATTDYSVDLVFEFLPDLFAISNRLEPNDPLVTSLKKLALEWPLSSVGIPLATSPESLAFASHPGLMRLYADRVSEKDARDRLSYAPLRRLLRSDAGLLSQLLPFPPSTYNHD